MQNAEAEVLSNKTAEPSTEHFFAVLKPCIAMCSIGLLVRTIPNLLSISCIVLFHVRCVPAIGEDLVLSEHSWTFFFFFGIAFFLLLYFY
jgi:hypothetical protein